MGSKIWDHNIHGHGLAHLWVWYGLALLAAQPFFSIPCSSKCIPTSLGCDVLSALTKQCVSLLVAAGGFTCLYSPMVWDAKTPQHMQEMAETLCCSCLGKNRGIAPKLWRSSPHTKLSGSVVHEHPPTPSRLAGMPGKPTPPSAVVRRLHIILPAR